MASVVIGTHELQRLTTHVKNAARQADLFSLMDAIGQQQEDAARTRISETKRSPDGKAWRPWSEKYAKTRSAQHSLLVDKGSNAGLLDSLTHQPDDDRVYVGSNLKYANVHLRGSDKIKARPYLDTDGGFADSHDRAELRVIVRSWMADLL